MCKFTMEIVLFYIVDVMIILKDDLFRVQGSHFTILMRQMQNMDEKRYYGTLFCIEIVFLLCFQSADQCSSNPCDVNAVCKNIPATHSCTCKAGFSGNGQACSGELLKGQFMSQF